MKRNARLLAVLMLALAAGLIALAWELGAHWAAGELREQGERQLQLLAPELESALEKYETLPYVLGFQDELKDLLRRPADKTRVAGVNAILQAIQRRAKVEALYLMDDTGLTLAASNWDQLTSFVGRSFGYRPYFQAARRGGVGRFYAIGTTSHEPGYFIAHPIRVGAEVAGVIAVKISLADFERNWASSEEALALVDHSDIVFLSNRADWKYHSLGPVSAARRAELAESHQYLDRPIEVLQPAPPAAGLARPIGRLGWRLLIFPSERRMLRAAAISAAGTALALLCLTIGVWAWHQRQRRLEEGRASAAALRRAAEELEARIAERTAQLQSTNTDLEDRVAALARAESVLRSTQDELVQAGKLAMLGQMAAGMTHELNQPLTALRAFADNARLFLARGQTEAAQANLQQISDACARMGAIIAQLKGFARKSDGVAGVALDAAVRAAMLLLEADIARCGARLTIDVPPLLVHGDSVRVEQVFINLLRNALDAVENAEQRQIQVDAVAEGDTVRVRISDSGPGIEASLVPRLGEPFLTTKPSGKGLGLGLAISSSIVQAMGGQLMAANGSIGGAIFHVILPLQKEGGESAGDPGRR